MFPFMKKIGKILVFVALVIAQRTAIAQSGIIISNYTACPNQVITAQATWNNVSSVTYTLIAPASTGTPLPGGTFTIVGVTPGFLNYTLIGSGLSGSGPVTSTVNFGLTIIAPAPLTITNTGAYCYGDNATLIAPTGATNYSVTGGCSNNLNSPSNIITLPNVAAGCNGQYTISAVVNGCARTGTTNVSVAPNHQITISPPVNICQGSGTTLSATLTSGADWQWLDNNNNPIPGGNNPSFGLSNTVPNQSGVYQVNANINFNGPNGIIQCPRSATTQVNVIQMSQVSAGASPANIVCQGANLNLTANASAATGWQWFGPQSFFSTSQNPVLSLVTPVNNGNYTVHAMFVGGATTCSTTAVVNIQIVPVTQAQITMPASICQNDTVYMSVNAGPNAQSYTWFGPCLQTVVGANASVLGVQPNCSGVYYATAKFSINTTECVSTASAALNVVPVNTITVVPPGTVCTPQNANLQSNANGANLFTWVGPNGFSTPGANVIVYYATPAATGVYTVTAYFGGGNLTCTSTNTLELTVYPILNFSLIPRQHVCFNVPLSVTGPFGATSYSWTSSTGFTSIDKDIYIPQIQPKDAGTYTLTVALGPCITKSSTIIDVLDPISYTLTPVDKTICRGDTLIFEAGATGGSQNYAYEWNPGLFLDSPTGPKKVATPLGSILYNLKVHDIACPNYSVAHTFSITVNQPPIPDLQLSSGYGCAPLSMVFNAKTKTTAAITTYDFGDGTIRQGDSLVHTYTDAGVYKIKVYTRGKNNCSYSYEYPYPLTVNPRPGTDFYTNPETPNTIDDITFVPTNQYEPITRYSWMFKGGLDLLAPDSVISAKIDDTDTSDIQNPLRSYAVPGRYPVTLITENDHGCIDTVFKLIDIKDELKIFIPNTFTPNGDGVNDVFYVVGSGMKLENFSMQIIDRWGNTVYDSKDINEGWDGKVKGVYSRDGTYTCFIKVVGMNGEGRKEITSYLNLIK